MGTDRAFRARSSLLLVASLAVVIAGCGTGMVEPTGAGPLPTARPALESLPPTAARVQFESATLSADNRVLTLQFTGGRPFDPFPPGGPIGWRLTEIRLISPSRTSSGSPRA